MVSLKRYILLFVYSLLSLTFVYATDSMKLDISISEIQTINNISTISVQVKNISNSKKRIIQPKSQQDSISMLFPWNFRILQDNIEFGSKTNRLVYGYSGKLLKIKKNEVLIFRVNILWDYMIDNRNNPIDRNKLIDITLYYNLFNMNFRSNTITIKPE